VSLGDAPAQIALDQEVTTLGNALNMIDALAKAVDEDTRRALLADLDTLSEVYNTVAENVKGSLPAVAAVSDPPVLVVVE
jgi:hypothetical protein